MTLALSTRDGVRDAVTAVASATAALLGVPAVLDSVLTESLTAELLPPEGSGRAVSINVRGAAHGDLVLVLCDDLAAAVADGPLGHQELVDALGPLLSDAAVALERYCGAALQVETAHEVDADIALAGMTADRTCAAVPLTADGRYVATVALLVDTAVDVPAPRAAGEAGPAAHHDFRPLSGSTSGAPAGRPLDLLHDVEMGVTAELGRTRMTVRDLLSLSPGSVVELDRAAGSPVDVLVNGTLIARGEVVVLDEEFGIRISEIIGMPAAPRVPR